MNGRAAATYSYVHFWTERLDALDAHLGEQQAARTLSLLMWDETARTIATAIAVIAMVLGVDYCGGG